MFVDFNLREGRHHFQKKRGLGTVFSTNVFGIVPECIFNGYRVLPGTSTQGTFIEIHATVVKYQGSKELRPGWVLDAARVDFLWIWEFFWEALAHSFSFWCVEKQS